MVLSKKPPQGYQAGNSFQPTKKSKGILGVLKSLWSSIVLFLKKHRRLRIVLGLLALLVVGVGLLYGAFRILLVVLGTIMQFWYNYTNNTFLLWFLTLFCFALVCGFGYLLWVRRAEYLRKEESELMDYSAYGEVDQLDDGWY